MTDDEIDSALEASLEELAAAEHERWAHWQRYLHLSGRRREDGSLVLPPDLVARWERQMATSYHDLSDQEKESDRQQVRRYLPIISAVLKSADHVGRSHSDP